MREQLSGEENGVRTVEAEEKEKCRIYETKIVHPIRERNWILQRTNKE